jgi:2-haloacid dehalogenase
MLRRGGDSTMIRAHAFDAYGTLFDVHAALRRHAAEVGPEADSISRLWRAKQLEYTWVRTLSGRYRDFWSLTEEALDFALASHGGVDPAVRQKLLDAYWRLEAYPDALRALERLRRAGQEIAIFTNGTFAMADAAANAAALAPLVDIIVSVDSVGRFKTAPETYGHLAERLGLSPAEICLVSSNRWDIAGGIAAGMEAVWVNRAGVPDEYGDLAPGQTIAGLDDLAA